MTFCYMCHKAWGKNGTYRPDESLVLWNIKTAKFDFCDCCRKRMLNEFEAQFPTVRLRIEGRR